MIGLKAVWTDTGAIIPIALKSDYDRIERYIQAYSSSMFHSLKSDYDRIERRKLLPHPRLTLVMIKIRL